MLRKQLWPALAEGRVSINLADPPVDWIVG